MPEEEERERDRESNRERERVACSAQLPAPCRGPSPIFNRPIALQTDRRSWCCSSMSTPYSFSAFPREPPKYPVINAAPSTGAVIANFGAEDVGRIFGTAAIGAVWGFVWGAPEPRLLVWFRVGGSGGRSLRPCAVARARTMHIGTACADGPGRAHPPPAASHDRFADLARQHTRLRQPAPACRLANPAAQPTIRGRHRWHDRQLRVVQVLNDETDWVLSEPKGVRARRPACRSWDAS